MAEDNLLQVLEGYEKARIEIGETFMKQSLEAATLSDNHECIGKLVQMGAKNIDECLALAKKNGIINAATAMLLLMKAASIGDKTLLSLRAASSSMEEEVTGCANKHVTEAIRSGKMSTNYALEVAQRAGQHVVKRELLLSTKVDKANGIVNWSKLRLLSLDKQLLCSVCDWLTWKLDLSANVLTRLPEEVNLLSKVTNVDLSNNQLSTVTAGLLQLPNLNLLNLSHNRITHLPDIAVWSAALSKLDLSNNHLTSMPMNITASALTSLNLSKNKLSDVPLCVCTFTTLLLLDISYNPGINILPYEMSLLTNLKELNLYGLNKLEYPPKSFVGSTHKVIVYLRNKLRSRTDGMDCIQLMIVGNSEVGKRMFASRIYGKGFNYNNDIRVCVKEWEYRPNVTKRLFQFRSWIFKALEDYEATHHCFLSQRALYIFLFNLNDGIEGVREIIPWLKSISYIAPCSTLTMVGISNLDEPNDVGDIMQQAKVTVEEFVYNLGEVKFFTVEAKKPAQSIKSVLDSVHHHTVNFPFLEMDIIREVENNGNRLSELLAKAANRSMYVGYLNQAMLAAVKNDNHSNIGKLVLHGSRNIFECLRYAGYANKPHARAMLLLIKAAQTGDIALVQKVFSEPVTVLLDKEQCLDDLYYDFFKGQEPALSVPIEIARRYGNGRVREELLLKSNVNQEEGYVYWNDLRLLHLDISLLRKIPWVKKLMLARNRLRNLPPEIGSYLKQVVKIRLEYNDLTTIPGCLLELPSLGELNLSSNQLTKIPEVAEWSPCLTVLDLSNNQLVSESLPSKTIAPAIRSLNLARNKFCSVPLCICSFSTLHSLNLSDNPNITTLPVEMGRLSYLSHLNLSGLNNLKDPPKGLQRDCRNCIRYLNSRLHSSTGFYRMKLIVLGNTNRGKTTLVARIQDREDGDERTAGVDVSEWWYRPTVGRRSFHFSIWNLRGQEEYYATHKCFLSRRSLYLVLFNLMHRDHGIEELRPWLDSIALRVPQSCVIIIGTHLDEVPDDRRIEVDALLRQVEDLARSYINKLQIVEILSVGLKNRIENIGLLKDAIYNQAACCKNRAGQLIMGQKIPASYHALDKQLEIVQHDVRQGIRGPIMHAEDFRTMVHQMNLADIQDDDELKTATLFLTDVGSILHFDDREHNLHELYFVDPCWLCKMIAKVATIKDSNPFITDGILYSKDIPMLLKDEQFPRQYFEQYLTLLDRFEIALPLDNKRVLIPSSLVDKRPAEFEDEKPDSKDSIYSRFIVFKVVNIHYGFWSRLLSTIIHSVSKVFFALDKSTPTTPETVHYHTSSSPREDTKTVFVTKPTEASQIRKDLFDAKTTHLEYWRTGLYYKDPEVMFRVESLLGSKHYKVQETDGVLLITSANNSGRKIIAKLVNLVMSLVSECYPELMVDNDGSNSLEQKVPCFECVKLGRAKPFEFDVEQCLPRIAKNDMIIKCGYFHGDPLRNHTVSLADIVPDLLLLDIDPKFLLSAKELIYQEDDVSLLGKGTFGKVYRGKYKGKSVAIKKYLSRSEDAFMKLRSEAELLQQCHHPCLVCLIGVCVHPLMALVMEEAPLKSLEFPILKRKISVHRLTVIRIAAEVAAALRFLHGQGIIFRDVKAANILLWTLDPDSLCHCKLADFGIATHLAPIGARGLQGTKGFIAPEILNFGTRVRRSAYDHRADIFSYGMFLYQIIARRYPYHNIPPHRIDVSVESGKRPNLHDVDVSRTGYHYLTQIMKCCWEDNPKHRPSTESIVKRLCMSPTQMVMCLAPIRRRRPLYQAIAIAQSKFAKAVLLNRLYSELWVCCSDDEGVEISMFNTHSMMDANCVFIKDFQVQCMSLCGSYFWVGSETGMIDIFSIDSKEIVNSVKICESSLTITCITASDKNVYLGTLEGYCISFNDHIGTVQTNIKQLPSEHAIDGIVYTEQCLWVAQMKYIYFLSIDNLALQGSLCRDEGGEAYIGQLSFDTDRNVIWSAHLGGVFLSAWNAHKKCHVCDIDTGKHIKRIAPDTKDPIITAMTPVLDTVWVGMDSGHIMVFHESELLIWFHAYEDHVLFLTCIPSLGPCGLEEAMVASGGRRYKHLVNDMEECFNDSDSEIDYSGTVIIWEAYNARRLRQVMLIERSPEYLDNHDTVCELIHKGRFRDGTNTLPTPEADPLNYEETIGSVDHGTFQEKVDFIEEDKQITTSPAVENSGVRFGEEEIKVQLLHTDQGFTITCTNPVQLDSVINEIQVVANLDPQLLHLFYSSGDTDLTEIDTQEELVKYLEIPNTIRTPLIVELHQSKQGEVEMEASSVVEERVKSQPNILKDVPSLCTSYTDTCIDTKIHCKNRWVKFTQNLE